MGRTKHKSKVNKHLQKDQDVNVKIPKLISDTLVFKMFRENIRYRRILYNNVEKILQDINDPLMTNKTYQQYFLYPNDLIPFADPSRRELIITIMMQALVETMEVAMIEWSRDLGLLKVAFKEYQVEKSCDEIDEMVSETLNTVSHE